MPAESTTRIGLLVRRAPYAHRIARAEADLALAAGALDFEVRVYFLGASALQLAARRSPETAQLPAGYRAWAGLPELADARFFVEMGWWTFCRSAGIELVVPVEPLEPGDMKRSWRSCRHVVAL